MGSIIKDICRVCKFYDDCDIREDRTIYERIACFIKDILEQQKEELEVIEKFLGTIQSYLENIKRQVQAELNQNQQIKKDLEAVSDYLSFLIEDQKKGSE